jgi:3-polyprenyl-4-hydroxybenzoate decarboxylase
MALCLAGTGKSLTFKKGKTMKDLRQFIGECEKRLPREFVRISKEVDPKFEITAIVKRSSRHGKA